MPGPDDLSAELSLEPRVEVRSEPLERGIGRGLEVGHDPVELCGVYLLQVQGALVVVGVAGFASEPVSQAGELAHGLLYHPAYGFRGLPDLPTQGTVAGGPEDLPDLVLPDLPALDDSPVVAVDGVRPGFEFLYPLQDLLVTLVPGERLVEHLDLTPKERVLQGGLLLVPARNLLVAVPVGEEPGVLHPGA